VFRASKKGKKGRRYSRVEKGGGGIACILLPRFNSARFKKKRDTALAEERERVAS